MTMPSVVRQWFTRRAMRRAHRLLQRLDTDMRRADISRAERRRFWRDIFAGRVDITDAHGWVLWSRRSDPPSIARHHEAHYIADLKLRARRQVIDARARASRDQKAGDQPCET